MDTGTETNVFFVGVVCERGFKYAAADATARAAKTKAGSYPIVAGAVLSIFAFFGLVIYISKKNNR